MADPKIISIDKIKVACSNCSLSALCLPLGLTSEDVDRLDSIVKRSRPLQRGDHAFNSGENFKSLYVVKTGVIKSYGYTNEGVEQVIGFHLPGELLGLDAIEKSIHGCNAKALETAALCEIPFDRLEELASVIPSLQHQMFRVLSKEIRAEAEMMSLLSKSTAEERLASFILSLSERFQRRGFSATDFNLSMSRQEIGSYLGLALETVSRIFTRFQEEGILKVERKHVVILNLEKLHSVITVQTSCPQSVNS